MCLENQEFEYIKEVEIERAITALPFSPDEIKYVEPDILHYIADGDIKGLTDYMRRVGGF